MTFDSHKRNEKIPKKNIRQEMLNLNAFTVICGGWVFEFFSKKFCSQRTEHNSQIENAFEMCNMLFSGAGGAALRGAGARVVTVLAVFHRVFNLDIFSKCLTQRRGWEGIVFKIFIKFLFHSWEPLLRTALCKHSCPKS